jgi:hypothetical protein
MNCRFWLVGSSWNRVDFFRDRKLAFCGKKYKIEIRPGQGEKREGRDRSARWQRILDNPVGEDL